VESLVGQRLGAYVLETEIGRGSMGVVYRAHHVEQGFPAAVKVLLDALASDESFVTRFTREAGIVRKLSHPNILRLYDTGTEGELLYFAMEYFAGSTAGQILKQRGRLPVGQVVEIAAQTADALNHAHTHGHLVHRDIKPENLLVDRWCRVKVLDFGLARVDGLHPITRAGTVVGSLYYVSPEQLMGQPLDGRSDVYALGVSMYEMLTGQRPYRGRTLSEMSEVILAGKAVPPSQIEASVPPALEAIIQRALARDLQWRYASAGELHDALRALQSSAVRATPTIALNSSDLRAQISGPIAHDIEAPHTPWRPGR
jgi:serine/threonine protein kinase